MPFTNQLLLNAVSIAVESDGGVLALDISFTAGLNVVRAENTSGKSTISWSILFALGLEELSGKPGAQAAKESLVTRISDGETEHSVRSSSVELIISNSKMETVGIRRWPKSPKRDVGLVEVFPGAKSLPLPASGSGEEMYAGRAGSATNARGFHHFLADFIGWELPTVMTFDGAEVPLYMQLNAPYWFVEQIRGWSTLYTAPSGAYSVPRAAQRAFEFLLGIDAFNRERRRQQLSFERDDLEVRWRPALDLLRSTERVLGVKVSGVSDDPRGPFSPVIMVAQRDGASLVDLDKELNDEEREVERIEAEIAHVPPAKEDERREGRLAEIEGQYDGAQSSIATRRQERDFLAQAIEVLKRDADDLDRELERNTEARTILKVGGTVLSASGDEVHCPTCGQELPTALEVSRVHGEPMNLDENITYIRTQKEIVAAALSQRVNEHGRAAAYLNRLEERSRELRSEIRALRTEVQGKAPVPRAGDIERLVAARGRLKSLRDARLLCRSAIDSLSKVSALAKDLEDARKKAGGRLFGDEDAARLDAMDGQLRDLLRRFGYKSEFSLNDVRVSRDSYLPISGEGQEIFPRASGSDVTRLKWAYLLALALTAEKHGGAHPGVLIIDEPGQQQMRLKSMDDFFRVCAAAPLQTVVFTSIADASLNAMRTLPGINIVSFPEDREQLLVRRG